MFQGMLTTEEWSAIRLSLQVAACSTLIGLLPAGLIGFLLARRRFAGKTVLDAVVHLPLVLPPVVVGYLLLVLLGRHGWVGRWLYDVLGVSLAFTWQGAALASAVMAFPLMVRSIRLGVEGVDTRLEQAARTLGAGRWRVWWTVTLPLARPGILTGMVLGFARSLGEFGATITFAGNIPGQTSTLPLAMYAWMNMPGEEHRVVRGVVVAMALSFMALVVSEGLAHRTARRLGRG